MPVGENHTLRFGPFVLDTQCGQLRKDGVGLKLQGQPIQVLEILLQKPGQLVTREEIRQRLWTSDTFVDFDHSLNTAVKKLRQTLGDEADTPRYIETLPKRGYRFIGEVAHEEQKPETREMAALTVPPIGQLEPRPSNRMRFWRRVVGPVLGLLAIASGVMAYFALGPEPQPRIVGSHVLTKTGNPKSSVLLIDRGSLYFIEERPLWVTLQVSTADPELASVEAKLGVDCCLIDVSRDGSEALWQIYNQKTKMCDTWVQSLLPAGTPRLVVGNACWPKWSADARSFFFLRNNNTELYRANVDGTGIEKLATATQFANPHLSPDGLRIRFTGSFRAFGLWEIGANGSNPHPVLSGYEDVWGGSWSSDGKYYFFTAWDGERSSLWAVSEVRHWWKKASTPRPHQLTFGPLSISSPVISKEGTQLYAVGSERRGQLSIYDSRSGKFVPYLGGQSICFVDFSRDGQWIAYVTYPEGTLWRSRIDGTERKQLTVPPLAPINPRWSPDGTLIAFEDSSNGDRRQMKYFGSPSRIYAISADGGAPMLLAAGDIGDPTWSADGRSIAYHYFPVPASEVRILDLQSQKSATLQGSQGMWSPRWSPDGKYLVAMAGHEPNFSLKLMLFSFANKTWTELASASDGFNWPCWSRDSEFVYAQDGNWLFRIAIANREKKQIASLSGFRSTAYYFDRTGDGWFGLAPDNRPLTTRDTGIEEVYAFDLEYK